MIWRLGIIAFTGLLLFPLTDAGGPDARFYSRMADYQFVTLGRVPEALKFYQQAYHGVPAANTTLQIRLLNNIGAMQLALFRYQDAEQTLLRVRKMAVAAHHDAFLGGA